MFRSQGFSIKRLKLCGIYRPDRKQRRQLERQRRSHVLSSESGEETTQKRNDRARVSRPAFAGQSRSERAASFQVVSYGLPLKAGTRQMVRVNFHAFDRGDEFGSILKASQRRRQRRPVRPRLIPPQRPTSAALPLRHRFVRCWARVFVLKKRPAPPSVKLKLDMLSGLGLSSSRVVENSCAASARDCFRLVWFS